MVIRGQVLVLLLGNGDDGWASRDVGGVGELEPEEGGEPILPHLLSPELLIRINTDFSLCRSVLRFLLSFQKSGTKFMFFIDGGSQKDLISLEP